MVCSCCHARSQAMPLKIIQTVGYYLILSIITLPVRSLWFKWHSIHLNQLTGQRNLKFCLLQIFRFFRRPTQGPRIEIHEERKTLLISAIYASYDTCVAGVNTMSDKTRAENANSSQIPSLHQNTSIDVEKLCQRRSLGGMFIMLR